MTIMSVLGDVEQEGKGKTRNEIIVDDTLRKGSVGEIVTMVEGMGPTKSRGRTKQTGVPCFMCKTE